MGLRDLLNRNPRASKAIAGLIIVGIFGLIIVQLLGQRRGITTALPDVYFTDDDGKTYFTASPTNVPPWDHAGKQAVAAHVYKTADGELFVGFMSRFTPEVRTRIASSKQVTAADEKARELKRPGDKEWVKASDLKRASSIVDVRGPKGQVDVEPIEPDM